MLWTLVLRGAVVVGILICLAGCGKKNDSGSDPQPVSDDANPAGIRSEPASGKKTNANWQYAGGYARPPVKDDGSQISVTLLSNQIVNPCDPFSARSGKDGKYVAFNVPSQGGAKSEFPTEDNQYISLGSGSNTSMVSVKAATGVVFVESVTAAEVSGRIKSEFDKNNFVEGTFIVQRCPATTKS